MTIRHFVATLCFALGIMGVSLFAVSCGDNQRLAGSSDEQVPGLIPGSAPESTLVDPENLSLGDVDAFGLAKANTNACRRLNGWYFYRDGDPSYWYSWGLIGNDQTTCAAKVYLGYTWKMRILIRNMADSDAGSTTYTLLKPDGTTETIATLALPIRCLKAHGSSATRARSRSRRMAPVAASS